MMKGYLGALSLCMMLLMTSIHAVNTGVFFSGGYDNFSDTFKSGPVSSFGLRMTDDEGVFFDVSLGYVSVQGLENNADLTRIPISVGLGHYFMLDAAVSPYLMGEISVNFLSDGSNDVGLGYAARVGIQGGRDVLSSWFLDGGFSSVDGGTRMDIDSMHVRLGWMLFIDRQPVPRSFRQRMLDDQRLKSRRSQRLQRVL